MAHLWHYAVDAHQDDERWAAAQGWLNQAEWARYHRFAFPEGRRQYLATRLLVRAVLSRYRTVRPAEWQFTSNQYGRPEISGPAGAPSLRFNLSNTLRMVVCVVSAHDDVGVDVEPLDRRAVLDVASRYFSAAEVAALRARPESEQPRRFLEYWTLKEAYIKARGMGLAIPLQQFSFDVEATDAIRVAFDPRLKDDETHWQFMRPSVSPEYLVAVAVRRPAGTQVAIEVKSFALEPTSRDRSR